MLHLARVRRAAVLAATLTVAMGAAVTLTPVPAAHAVVEGLLDVTVQGPDGSPLSGAGVTLYQANQVNPDPITDPDWHPVVIGGGTSGDDGVAHLAQEIPLGQTVLEVRVLVEKAGYFPQWYQAAANYTNANNVSMSDGNLAEVSVALSQKLRIVDVYVYDPVSEADLGNTTVGLFAVDGDGVTPTLTRTTNGSGVAQFKLGVAALDPNFYRIRATRAGYLDQWWVDPPGSSTNTFDGATSLDLTGETGSFPVNIAMTAGDPVPFAAAPKPTIAGKARKGETLKARPGDWDPIPTFRFRWYRGSHAIDGATAKSYTLRKADVGKRISVKVKGSRNGYVTTTRTSAKTATVKP